MLCKKIFFIALLLIPGLMHAQVTGTVSHAEGGSKKALPGVNIYWLGTSIGTVSDSTGRYQIDKPADSDKLIFSFVGFKTDTISVKQSSKKLDVTLSASLLLDEVTIGERNTSTTIDHLDPLVTQRITSHELKQAACCNLGESFETNASVDAAYSDAATGAKQIKLLGLSGKYVQLLTENIPNFYGLASSYGLEYVPGHWMNSIAISKGTAAVSYGYEAITGQINTWYKEPARKADYFFLNLLGNSAGKTEINMDGTVKINDKISTMLLVHGGYDFTENDHDHDGFFDMPVVKRYILFNRYNVEWSPGFESKFGVKYLNESRQGGQSRHLANPYIISIDTRRAEAFFKSGYTYNSDWHRSMAFISAYSYHNQQSVYGNTLYNAVQHSVYTNFIYTSDMDDAGKHSLQNGLSYKLDSYHETLNLSNTVRTEHVPGAFAEYSYKPGKSFTGVAGIRADYHNLYGFFITPRMHLRYSISGTTTLKASAGKGTRTPMVLAENAYLFASSRQINIANDLMPEEAWNVGGNISQIVPAGNREITIVADFYRTWFTNQIVVDLDSDINTLMFYNLEGKSYSNVAQIEVIYPFVKGMDFNAAFRFNDVKQEIGGVLREVPFTSNYKALVSASYKTPLKKWQFDFTAQFNGGGRIPSTIENPEPYRRGDRFAPYTILNAQITKYFKYWEMYAGSENITNFVQHNPIIAADNPHGEHFDAAMIWGPVHGRKFYIGIRYALQRD